MLKLMIKPDDKYDEERNLFIYSEPSIVELEHSLYAISKWEAKWQMPYFHSEMDLEQNFDYIICMLLNEGDAKLLANLNAEQAKTIKEYVEDKQTASWITDRKEHSDQPSQIITSELIYYWMTVYGIPFECEHWNVNRLLMLIKICEAKTAKEDKMSNQDILEQNKAINERRKRMYNTKG